MRNHQGTDHVDGVIVLTCQDGHELGRVLKQPGGQMRVLPGRGWATAEPLATPLRMRCAKCAAAGQRQDLRGSWPKIDQLLDALVSDPTRGPTRYKLGG